MEETKSDTKIEMDFVDKTKNRSNDADEDDKSVENIKTEKRILNVPKDDSLILNSKSLASVELLDKIKKQVEFYFGNVNMQRDKFLIEQTKLDAGWVPMTTMLNFKMLASLSKDVDTILNALKDSNLIEISEDNNKIRRSSKMPLPAYDEEYRKAQEARTIYVKGFSTDSTIETLKSFFEFTDAIESIIMRKYKKGKEYFFKGSIFLQFKTLDDAKIFMEQKSIFNNVELFKLWSADYVALKEKEKEERRLKKIKGLNNQKVANITGSKHQNNYKQDKVTLSRGCIIHISNIQKDITREMIKQKLMELNFEVAYIDYNSGDTEGWIRLQGENSAVNFLTKINTNVIQVDDSDITCKLLEGREEETYLFKIQENMASHRLNRREKGRNARRNAKRRHSPHRDGYTKKLRTDNE